MSLLAILVALGTALPLYYLAVHVAELGPEGIRAIIVRPRTLELLITTGFVVVGVGILTLILGIGTATIVSRVALPAPSLWWIVLALPVAVPSYVAAFALVALRPGTHGVAATIAVISLSTYPYVTLATLAAYRRADHAAADVARSLGASPVRAFITVTLPQILPAASAGGLLCVLYALSDYAAPALLRTQTLTVGVYGLFSGSLNRGHAGALGLVLVVVALLFISFEQWARRRSDRSKAAIVVRRVPKVALSPWQTTGLAALVLLPVFAVVVVPVGTLLLRLMSGTRYAQDVPDLIAAAGTTLALGALTALIATLAALPIAALSARFPRPWVRVTEGVSFLGQALPSVIIALAVVFMSLRLTPALYQTLPALIFAYVLVFVPKSIGSSRAAIQQVSVRLPEVAQVLGRRPSNAWWTITARHAWPGIGAGAVFVMAGAMKEVPMTLMIRPIGVDTLATELWAKTSIDAYTAGAPAALALILVGLAPAWLLSKAARE